MLLSQARGYLFELVVFELLKKSGYVRIKTGEVRGRGTGHQIDSHAEYLVPTPFVNPIRLICETKHYNRSVGLAEVRSFTGVMKDISENYFVRGNNYLGNKRYTDAGCFFSVENFTLDAQKYAWAHNIFLVSFAGIPKFEAVVQEINAILFSIAPFQTHEDANINTNIQNLKKMIRSSSKFKEIFKNLSFFVGILDNIYPVILAGTPNLVKKLTSGNVLRETDKINAEKSDRQDGELGSYFSLDLAELEEGIQFSLPKFTADKIINRISRTAPGSKIFNIDLPFVAGKIRRIFQIQVTLPIQHEHIQ